MAFVQHGDLLCDLCPFILAGNKDAGKKLEADSIGWEEPYAGIYLTSVMHTTLVCNARYRQLSWRSVDRDFYVLCVYYGSNVSNRIAL